MASKRKAEEEQQNSDKRRKLNNPEEQRRSVNSGTNPVAESKSSDSRTDYVSLDESRPQLFDILPIELWDMIGSWAAPFDRLRFLKLSAYTRSCFQRVESIQKLAPNDTPFRVQASHLFTLGRLLASSSPKEWKKYWFTDSHLNSTDRFEIFTSSTFRRQTQLYRIVPVAGNGNGTRVDWEEGRPALSDSINPLMCVLDICMLPDRSLLLGEFYTHCIRRVDPEGIFRTFAGTQETPGITGDGGPASKATLGIVASLSRTPDGGVLLADAQMHCIRKIDSSGVITRVAGCGVRGYGGDGELAVNAKLNGVFGVFACPDGRVLIADSQNHRVRMVGLDGKIVTIAGTGVAGCSGDGGKAIEAKLSSPTRVCMGPDGRIYMVNTESSSESRKSCVRVIDTDGIIHTIVHNGMVAEKKRKISDYLTSRDVMKAPEVKDQIIGVNVAKDGRVFVCSTCVDVLDQDGTLVRIAGDGTDLTRGDIVRAYSGDGGAALDASLRRPNAINFEENGRILIADSLGDCVRALEGWFEVKESKKRKRSDEPASTVIILSSDDEATS